MRDPRQESHHHAEGCPVGEKNQRRTRLRSLSSNKRVSELKTIKNKQKMESILSTIINTHKISHHHYITLHSTRANTLFNFKRAHSFLAKKNQKNTCSPLINASQTRAPTTYVADVMYMTFDHPLSTERERIQPTTYVPTIPAIDPAVFATP